MEVWQDFGQRIDLAVRIRDVLHDYPEGTSVLKELIQVGSAYQISSTAEDCLYGKLTYKNRMTQSFVHAEC
jgi:hypothetical protein